MTDQPTAKAPKPGAKKPSRPEPLIVQKVLGTREAAVVLEYAEISRRAPHEVIAELATVAAGALTPVLERYGQISKQCRAEMERARRSFLSTTTTPGGLDAPPEQPADLRPS